jgi:hypothetical protein
MATFYAVFGTRFFIGSACVNAPFPAADEYSEITLIENFGDLLESAQDMSQIEVDQDTGIARTVHVRAEKTSSNLDVTCYWSKSDSGQAAVLAAYRGGDGDYNFKLMLPDGSITYYLGPILSHDLVTGVGSNVIRRKFSIAINDCIS